MGDCISMWLTFYIKRKSAQWRYECEVVARDSFPVPTLCCSVWALRLVFIFFYYSNTLATWCKELTHLKKDPDAGKDWRQEKGTIEDKMVGWHHGLKAYEFAQAPGNVEGGLVCCSPWDPKQLDTIVWLNWTGHNCFFLHSCYMHQIYYELPLYFIYLFCMTMGH